MGNLEMIERRAGDPRIQRLASNTMMAEKGARKSHESCFHFHAVSLSSPEYINLNEQLLEFKPLIDQAARPCAIELKS